MDKYTELFQRSSRRMLLYILRQGGVILRHIENSVMSFTLPVFPISQVINRGTYTCLLPTLRLYTSLRWTMLVCVRIRDLGPDLRKYFRHIWEMSWKDIDVNRLISTYVYFIYSVNQVYLENFTSSTGLGEEGFVRIEN